MCLGDEKEGGVQSLMYLAEEKRSGTRRDGIFGSAGKKVFRPVLGLRRVWAIHKILKTGME